MNDLVNGAEANSAANLLQLSTLLNAILYTQGDSNAQGPFRELALCPSKCSSTRTPARTLKPLVQALTSAGAGRFEMVKSAVERGAFNDLRLLDPAIKAFGDNYPELAELVAERVLPAYGPGIIPLLKAGFDLKGNKQDARKLQVMHNLDPDAALAFCKTALDDGSPEVKATALACLGKHEDSLPLVLAQVNAKNRIVRAAALEALAQHDRPEVTKIFTDLLKGKALDLLARPFRLLRNSQVLHAMLDEGKKVFALLLQGDSEQLPRFSEILECLKTRSEPEVEQFLIECLTSQPAKLAKLKPAKNSALAGDDLLVRLASALYSLNTPTAVAAILSQQALLPPKRSASLCAAPFGRGLLIRSSRSSRRCCPNERPGKRSPGRNWKVSSPPVPELSTPGIPGSSAVLPWTTWTTMTPPKSNGIPAGWTPPSKPTAT